MQLKFMARGRIAGLVILGSAISTLGYAVEAPTEGTLEEIVVTAQKRSESVQDVPVSVTVLTSDELGRQGVQTIADLSRMSASLEFTASTAAPGGGAFIRGIGTESVGGDTATASVSVVLDGVVLGNTNITDIFDVSRVEILKGPQGTLFGSSVSAGVISLTTNAPDPSKMSSTVSIEYGSGDMGSEYDRRSLRATTNLPLTADSALRVSAHADENLGVFTNPFEGTSSDDPDVGIRARYLWNVNDAVSINLIGDYNKEHNTNEPVLTYRAAPAGSALATSLAACGVTASETNFAFCSQYNDYASQLDRGVSGQIDWTIGGNTLTSISSLRHGDYDTRRDIEELPLSIAETNFALGTKCFFVNCVPIFSILPGGTNDLQTQQRSQISEEIRLASPKNNHLEWVAGVYYQHYKLDDDEPGTLTANFGGGEGVQSTFFHTNVRTTDYAGFGNVTYYLSDDFRLIAGARFTHSEVSETKFDPPDTGTQNVYDLSTSASKPSFRVGLQKNFSQLTMAYATVSTGYKAPEISDALANGGSLFAVRPELPTSYEIGIKHSAFNDKLAIDADVFYEKVKDYQGQACSPNATGTVTCTPVNVPNVNTKGIELDVFGRPLAGLTLNLSGILNPATYPGGYLGSDGSNLGGHQLNYSSKTKVTFSGEQTIPMTDVYSFVVGADAAYRSAQSMYTSALPEFVVPTSTIFNARLGIRSSSNWSVFAFGRNLGSKAYPRQLFPTPFQPGGLWQAFDANSLRVVGLQLEAKF
jgi:iron complex outermembrane recepter protein